MIEKFVAAFRNALPKVELISTPLLCGDKNDVLMPVAGYVTLGNSSCNLCRPKMGNDNLRASEPCEPCEFRI